MNSMRWKRGVVALGFISAVTAQASDEAFLSPSWKDERVARVNYSTHGDLRKGADMMDYRINEDGAILGHEILENMQFAPYAVFKETMESHPEGNPQNKPLPDYYMEYKQANLDESVAIAALNRIIDHEAMKRKIPPNVSDERVDYVLRAILTQNAANKKKIRARETSPYLTDDVCPKHSRHTLTAKEEAECRPHTILDKNGKVVMNMEPDENVSSLSNEQMYPWLRETIGQNAVKYHMDWKFNQGGIELEQRALTFSKKELPWPEVTLEFVGTPGDGELLVKKVGPDGEYERDPKTGAIVMVKQRVPGWQVFRDSIRDQLQPSYRRLMRIWLWQQLVDHNNPFMNLQAQVAATPEQKQAYYAGMKEKQFKVNHFKSDFVEIRLEESEAAFFAELFKSAIARFEAKYETEFSQALNGPSDAASEERIRNRIVQLRKQGIAEAYQQTVYNFARDIATKHLRVSKTEGTFFLNSDDPKLESTPYYEDHQFAFAFEPQVYLGRHLIPFMTEVAKDGSLRIMFPLELKQLDSTYYSANDPRAANAVEQNIISKVRGVAFRKAAQGLFQDNRVEYISSLCRDVDWPCGTSSPRKLAEALFPEEYFVDANHRQLALPPQGPTQAGKSNPMTSTLGHENEVRNVDSNGNINDSRHSDPRRLIDYVAAISLDGFKRVIDLDNEHVDDAVRWAKAWNPHP